jgi:hypothetical protein
LETAASVSALALAGITDSGSTWSVAGGKALAAVGAARSIGASTGTATAWSSSVGMLLTPLIAGSAEAPATESAGPIAPLASEVVGARPGADVICGKMLAGPNVGGSSSGAEGWSGGGESRIGSRCARIVVCAVLIEDAGVWAEALASPSAKPVMDGRLLRRGPAAGSCAT